jgi:hypothetical protein
MKRWGASFTIIFISSLILWNPYNSITAQAQASGPGNTIYLTLAFQEYDPSWQWGSTAIVTLTPTPADKPLMAIDHAGHVHIFWDVWPSSGEAFIYHTYQTDTGWSTPAKIANTLGMSYVLAQPLITPDGRIHLLWYNQLAYGGKYRFMYASFDGSQWSSEVEIAQTDYQLRYGLLNYDSQGDIEVVYVTTNLFTRSYYLKELTPVGWSSAVDITPPMVNGLVVWNVWPDNLSGVRFLGRDLYSNIVYSYWKDGGFQTSLQLLPAVTWSDSFVLDNLNIFHLFRIASVPIPGGSVSGLYHQCLDTALNWSSEQVLTGQSSIGDDLALSWDNSGRVVFAWKTYGSADFNLSVMTGCNLPESKTSHFTAPNPSIHWGHLNAIALSNLPSKICALAGIQSQPQSYGLVCADFLP